MDPAARIDKEILAENASLWFYSDESITKIIVKAYSDMIKAMVKGCKVELLFGKDVTSSKRYFHTAIRIYDDPIHFATIIGPIRFLDEHLAIAKVFELDDVIIDFYTELGFCSASATAKFYNSDKLIIREFQGNPETWYVGEFDHEITISLDCFEYSADKTRSFSNVYEIPIIKAAFEINNWQTTNMDFVGFKEANHIKIDDSNEGSTQEKQIWAALDNVFHFDLFKNPVTKKGNQEKEFIDIFAHHTLGLFLIESKALGIIASSSDKSMNKKVATLQKHVRKALKQLVGANKTVVTGIEIFDQLGQPILFNRNIVPHCIILVSELLPFGEWKEIQMEIFKVMQNENIYIHLMGFSELMYFLKAAKGRKEYFDFYLMERAEAVVKSDSLFVDFKFVKE